MKPLTSVTFYKIAVFLMLFVLLQVGCKKDSTGTTTYAIQGLWMGTTQDGTNVVPFYLSVKPDGTCTCEGLAPGTQENLGYGTYTLVNSTFTFNITWVYGYSTNVGVKVSNTATFNSSNGTLTNGIYHAVAPSGGTNDGTFSLTKVK